MNQTHFDRYARILVEHGAGLAEGQRLFVHGEWVHRDLIHRIAEVGYDLGAASVSCNVVDMRQVAQLIRRGRLERIELFHERERAWLNEIVSSGGALISLRGEEDPRRMPRIARDFPDRHAVYTRAASAKGKIFLNHGVNRSLCPWVVAGAVTPAWAKLVFPELEEEEATDRLWQHIFAFTLADREDAVERAAEKDRRLHARRQRLDELEIREIRVVGGNSDLRVGLSNAARWLGGSKTTVSGQTFNANVPTEENFTTPDRRRTEGRLAATMPFRTKSGLLVEDLVMHFEEGRLVRFEAAAGGEGFERWIETDPGARFLGEFALVGQDSPIAETGLFFEHTLYDENAWSHVALGQAYTTALEQGEHLNQEQLKELGCNSSSIHTDIMFGSTDVSIIATETREGEVTLIDQGHWTERFLDPES